jgi:hypothetical protein
MIEGSSVEADIGGLLSSPVWTVLATLLAAAAIWVSIWLYRRQRTRKALSYEVQTTSLVSIHSAAEGRIKVFFEGDEVEQAHLVETRVENSGNVPVEPDDFNQPIIFDLGKGASALTVDVTGIMPADLHGQVVLNGQEVELRPLLLNPGDGLTLKVIARDFAGKVTCHYRIVGISHMDDGTVQKQREHQRDLLRRLAGAVLESPFGSLLVSGAVAAVALIAVPAFLTGVGSEDKKTETSIELSSGKPLCGKVLVTSDRRMVVRLADTGYIRSLSLRQVEAIHEDSC